MRAAIVFCAVLAAVALSATAALTFQQKERFSSVEYLRNDAHALFEEWATAFGKSYETPTERASRFAQFQRAVSRIIAHNSRSDVKYTMGLTQFADMTVDELASKVALPSESRPAAAPAVGVPPEWDWRNQGAVTPVQNQGQCGSSWAFGAIAALEALWAIKTGKLVELSVQQIMDCDTLDYGCNGGFMWNAYFYVEQHGLCSAKDYPYTATSGTCKKCANPVIPPHWVNGIVNVTETLAANLEALTVNVVSNAIDLSQDMMYYTGGVFDGTCSPNTPDHGICTVGYGTDPKAGPYWSLKNSFGEDWGEKGYLRLSRDVNKTYPDGLCALFTYSQYPTH